MKERDTLMSIKPVRHIPCALLTTPSVSTNIVWHRATVTRVHREAQNGHRGAILWLTGLSGAGKSTLAHAVEDRLHQRGCRSFVLDGDNVRHGLCGDLGFSMQDRQENIRRIGEVAKLFMEAGWFDPQPLRFHENIENPKGDDLVPSHSPLDFKC